MANYYFDNAEQARITGNQSALFQFGPQGIRYFQRYLAVAPQDNDARADLATLLFYNGQTDRAIQEVGKVLSNDPNHVNGNFNLGIFLAQGRRDFPAAAKQFEKVIALTENDPQPALGLPGRRRLARADRRRPQQGAGRRSRAQEQHSDATEHIDIAIIGGGPAGWLPRCTRRAGGRRPSCSSGEYPAARS